MAGKHFYTLLFSLPLAWATATMAATPAVPTESGATIDPAEVIEPSSVTTGGTGTTSGITGSDMDQETEGSGSGQTRGDDLFQTPAAAPDAGPAYETETPEPASDADDEQTLPDEPLGAADSGVREDNETQANNGESQASDGESQASDGESQASDGESQASDGESQASNGEPQASRGRNSD